MKNNNKYNTLSSLGPEVTVRGWQDITLQVLTNSPRFHAASKLGLNNNNENLSTAYPAAQSAEQT